MKRFTFLCGTLLLSLGMSSQTPSINVIDGVQAPWEQQMTTVYQYVNLASVTTHVLLDRGIPFCHIENFDPGTTDNSKASTFTLWQNLYGTLFSSAWQSQYRLPDPQTAYLNSAASADEGLPIPCAIIAYNYHRIDPDAFQDGLFSVQNDQVHDVPNRPRNPYLPGTCFSAATMLETVHSLQSQFVFRQDLYFSNNGKTVSSIQVDFADGLGFRTVQWNAPIAVQYTVDGDKYIRIRLNYTDNSSLENSAKLVVDVPSIAISGRYSTIFQSLHFTGVRQFNGSTGGALVTIALGCGNVKLTKPLIVVEGFDPPQRPFADQNHFDNFRNGLDQQRIDINGNPIILGADLENSGYDLVFIDFDDGGDYIQRSAYLVEEIILWVNAQLVNNGSAQQNVVWGVSNGGLIARYALREMEMMGVPHNTRQYVAFDSPQQGANFPLGFQLMVFDVANTVIYGHHLDVWQPQLHTAVEILSNPAALQALVYHATAFPQTTPERTTLMNWFNTNGYPLQCERVVVSNGANAGISEPFAPGAALMNMVGGQDNLDYEFDVNAVPYQNAGLTAIYEGYFRVHVGPVTIGVINTTIQVSGTLPYDSAPGGVISLSGMGVDLSFLPNATATLYFLTYCFVPTVSAVDIVAPYDQNLYANVQSLGIIANNRTPFNSYWASITVTVLTGQVNEPHVAITGGNVDFFHDLFVGSNTLVTANGFPILLGANYNYGRNSAQYTTDIIRTGFTIGNGSTISVNSSQNLGLPSDNLAPPTIGSLFNVRVGNAGCSTNPIVIEVANNGVLSLGDINGNRGNIYFGSGSTLLIRNGGKLIVNNNSRIIIEEGARIIYESGAQIFLNGDNAVLEIQGTLELGTNALFKIRYPNFNSGYVKFSRPSWVPYGPSSPDYQIIAGAGSSIELIGANKNDKILEIAQSALWIPDGLDHFKFDHGLVEFAGNQNQNPILSIGCPIVQLTTARFIKAPNSNGGHGVHLYGQPNHTITNCYFEELGAGLVAENFYNIGMLKISACRFIQCGTGLVVYDKGVILSAVRFDYCGVGADLNGLTFNSTITNCKFNDNSEVGLRAKGSPIEIVMNGCDAKRNGTAGIEATGVTMNLACCDLRDNGVYAMILDYDASLRMSPIFNGGNNNLGNNQIPIILNEANQIEISGGRNKLKPDGPSCNGNPNQNCPDVFVGTIQTPCTPYVINADNNEWKGNNNNATFIWNSQQVTDLPLSVNDVTAVGCTNVPVRFSDPSQQNFAQCTSGPNGPPGGGGGPPNQNLSPLNNCANCNSINTASFSNTPTDSAARTAIVQMDSTLQSGYSDAVGMFNEILMYPLPNETAEDKYVKKAARRKMHEALGEGIYRNQINYSSSTTSVEAAEVIQAEADEKDKGDQSGEYHRMYFAAMREAAAYRASGKRDVALQKFEDILTWVLPAEEPWTKYWVCLTSKELEVMTNQAPKETFFDVVQECIPLHLSAPALRLAGSEIEEDSDEAPTNELNATIFPNPASEVLTIEISQSANSLVTFELYSATGQLVKTQTVYGGVQTQIEVSDLDAGLYFYRLIGEGDRTKEGRLVITH